MSTPLTWILGLAGLALLVLGCAALHAPEIETGLAGRTAAAVSGVSGVSPRVDGRDVTLVGTVADDAQREQALAAAATVRGVRVVRDGLTVGPAGAPPAPAAGAFSLAEEGRGLVVRGRVPDEAARAAVLARIGAAFSGRDVTDEMTTDPAAPDLLGVLGATLPVLGSVAMPDVTSTGAVVSLRGRVASAEDKARVEAAIRAALPEGMVLQSALGIAAPDATSAADQIAASGDARLAGAEAALAGALGADRIVFASGTARLTAESRAVLDRVAAVFARFPAAAADVKGYTDAEGDARGNRRLSTQRAEATRDYLAQKNIDAARLAPRGFGEADPVADNATEDGRARNRRVVFALRQN